MLTTEALKLVSLFTSSIAENAAHEITPQFQEQIFKELSRSEELDSSHRDIWGNWDWSYSKSHLNGLLYKPWIDQQLLKKNNKAFSWPGKKPFALCLTHDVDIVKRVHPMNYQRAFARSLKNIRQGDRSPAMLFQLFKQPVKLGIHLSKSLADLAKKKQHFQDYHEAWIKLEDRFGFRSTFFFFPSDLLQPHPVDCLYHFQDEVIFSGKKMTVANMMQEIDKNGWEVGLHGSYHSATVPGILQHEKKQIEHVLGKSVISTRQHWLHYDAGITPRLQSEAGLKVDSTQGFNRSIGFRAGTSFPYHCWDHKNHQVLPLLEIPQHIMDGALFTPNALEYDKKMAIRHAMQIMDEVESVGGCLTLSWHPLEYYDAKSYGVYEELLQEAHRRGAWGCSAGQLYNWWTSHNAKTSDC